jgi:hypothetical protein
MKANGIDIKKVDDKSLVKDSVENQSEKRERRFDCKPPIQKGRRQGLPQGPIRHPIRSFPENRSKSVTESHPSSNLLPLLS